MTLPLSGAEQSKPDAVMRTATPWVTRERGGAAVVEAAVHVGKTFASSPRKGTMARMTITLETANCVLE